MGVNKSKRPILAPNKESDIPGLRPSSYSTVEQDSGLKWTDGKTIYQKTLAVNLPNNNTATTAHGISGLARVIKIEQGSFLKSSAWHALPRVGSGAVLTDMIEVFVDGTNISLKSTGDHATGGSLADMTLWYTKS